MFPKPDPANFTAASPTKETVNAFLQASWGYDENRVWQVQAILKTPVEGVSKVVVLVGDKTGKQKPSALEFFALPDGKHIIAGDEIVPFGEHPFADYRAELQQRADGPYRGSASKDLETGRVCRLPVPALQGGAGQHGQAGGGFSQGPHRLSELSRCRPSIPQAANAAAYGVCVAKLGGSNAFFTVRLGRL